MALAVERWADAWPRYAVDLGGEWASGGQGPGFAPSQLRFANGAKLELIAPHRVEDNDFLRRYLDRHGPGPHHLTYKVADLAGALDAVRDAGFHPVGVDVSDRTWKEAFLHPAEACGVVVQLAQPSGAGWKTPAPAGFPTARAEPASLTHVAHAVADLGAARRLFADVLGGEPVDSDGGSVELAWPDAALRVRLVTPNVRNELDGRPGRVEHLAFDCPNPSGVPGAVDIGGDIDGERHEVPPDMAGGVRLVLRSCHH